MIADMTGGNPVDNDKTLLARGINVVAANRVTVDCRILEWRQIDRRDDIGGKHTAKRRAKRYRFAPRYGIYARAYQPLSLGDRQKRPTEGKAIVSQLHHQPSLRRGSLAGDGLVAA
jgi:hypothetical protein